MMKAFVSYSFRDSELHIVTLLFEGLRAKGFIVDSSITYGILSPYLNDSKIKSSDYFIGIITNNTDSVNTVLRDWKVAKLHQVNNILVIEEGVEINDATIKHLRFNRSTPMVAINTLLNGNAQKKNTAVDEVLAAGAITVVLAALISLLSGSYKK